MAADTTHIKIKYILLRYSYESKGLSDTEKIEKLSDWISKCTRSEEYEMAHALLQIKNNIINRQQRKGEKSFWDRLVLKLKIFIRKWRT